VKAIQEIGGDTSNCLEEPAPARKRIVSVRGKSPCIWEQVCKPNSVLRSQIRDRSGDHSSSPTVAGWIKRPTRRLRAGDPGNAFLFGLAPRGVCLAAHVTTRAGALLH